MGAITARVDASASLPVRVRKTIWSASPACAGKRPCSRSTARCESVFGSEKLFAFRLPAAWETARTPTARTIQATTTIRRCAIVQRVNLSIGETPIRVNLHASKTCTACRDYRETALDANMREVQVD